MGGANPDRFGTGGHIKLPAEALTKAGVDYDIKEYPAACHDFMTDHLQDRVPFLIKVVAAVLGGQYHPEAAEDSQKRILAFFAKHLKG